jgi:hypothetical protein
MGNCVSTRKRREQGHNGNSEGGEEGTNLSAYPQPANRPRPAQQAATASNSPASHHSQTQEIGGFSGSSSGGSEIERQDNTPQYKNVAMGKAEIASAGEGLSTWGLTDCSAIAVLSNFNSESERYQDMGMFHIAGSHVESVANTPGAMSVIQDLAKGEYTVVLVYGAHSASDYMKSTIKEHPAISQLLSGAKKKQEYTGSRVSIDRSGTVEVQ